MAVSGVGALGALAFWESKAVVSNSQATTASSAKVHTADASATTQVTLSSTGPVQAPTYSKPLLPKLDQVAWAAPPGDNISSLMKANLRYSDDSPSLLRGIGSALLGRFATTQDDFQQAAVDITSIGGKQSIATNNVSLKIHLVSGKEVDLSVSFSDGNATQKSLSVAVHTSGKLTAAEQAAVAGLSAGFEAALQGISRNAAKIDVAGLAGFDASKVASVDLSIRSPSPPVNAAVSTDWNPIQSLDFHADANNRSLSVKSLAGNVSVNVDMSRSAFLGTTAQQQVAIQNYLNQFDAANTRGHGDSILLGEFKDAFAQLNSQQDSNSSVLSAQDLAVLSGLNDFRASMSGDFRNDIAKESGHIDYQVSQSTQVQGMHKESLSVVQAQTASLSSEYAKYRDAASLAKGDYEIHRVNDSTSTTTTFEYAKNKLKAAFITNSVNQLDEYEKLVGFRVMQKKETPTSRSTQQDISARWRSAPNAPT